MRSGETVIAFEDLLCTRSATRTLPPGQTVVGAADTS
jgi:hypothetical protein